MSNLWMPALLGLAVFICLFGLATAHVWMVPREHQPKPRQPRRNRKKDKKPD